MTRLSCSLRDAPTAKWMEALEAEIGMSIREAFAASRQLTALRFSGCVFVYRTGAAKLKRQFASISAAAQFAVVTGVVVWRRHNTMKTGYFQNKLQA